MKTNKTIRGLEAHNHRRGKGKQSESSIDSTAHNWILIQQKQLNVKNHHIPININTDVNGLNYPIKRHHLANCIKKEYLTICCLQGTHLSVRNKHWFKVKGFYQAHGPWKQAGVAVLISDKVDFKLTLVKWEKEGHFILIKGAIHQKEITIFNLYAPEFRAPSFIKHTPKDVKAYIDSNTVVVGDFNTPPSPTGRSSKQKINKEILKLKWHHKPNGPNWFLQNISHNNNTIHVLLSSPWNFLKIDHVLGHKASLNDIGK
jgi:hypothetical protein